MVMNTRQAGVSLMGLIIVLVILAVVALFGMKVVPTYMEFRAMKNAIQAIARERPGANPAEVHFAGNGSDDCDRGALQLAGVARARESGAARTGRGS